MKLINQGDLPLFVGSPSGPSVRIKLSSYNIVVVVSDSPIPTMGNATDHGASSFAKKNEKEPQG